MGLIRKLLLTVSVFGNGPVYAHSGGLDSQGCHGGSKPYHCHRSASEMVPSTSGGYRLKCSAGSRSEDCKKVAAIEEAKKQCAELGFTKGTEKFGDCVMKLID